VAVDQAGGLGHVAPVAAGQLEGDGHAEPAHGQVDLGAQAATGTPKGLIFSPFLAPLAYW
jgi:hypothetical protein